MGLLNRIVVRSVVRPVVVPRRVNVAQRRIVRTAVTLSEFEEISYFVGKNIILFTFFYSTLNWLHYRNINKKK